MLILTPIGGLCNRMRAINSALTLAERRGEKLKVIWNVSPELGCPFEELFLPTDAFTLRNIHSPWDPVKLFYQFTSRRIGNEEIRSNRDENGLPDSFVNSLPPRLYIATEEHFFKSRGYSAFVPAPDIRLRADEILHSRPGRKVGVHIRRTDNRPAISGSSTDAFVQAMDAQLQSNPDTVFYLATDDMTEEAALRARFPDRILSNEGRDLSRDSISGIRDALLDLICLSETDMIIGSYFSSFTDIAADMRGIPKIIAGQKA